MLDYQVILRCQNDNGKKFDLGVVNIPKFLLDISAIEIGDIGQVFGTATQQFQVPGDDNSNKFFNMLFDLGATPAVALNKSVPCQILVDGEAVYQGKLYINNIVSDDENNVIYNCTVANETIDFRILNETKTLQQLNWSDLTHTYTYANISRSWEDQLFGGKIFYPLINYGFNQNEANSPAFEVGGQKYQMDYLGTPLLVSQFKPAIQAKVIVDKIFDSVNYKYTSSFFNSDFFKNLYILTTPDDKDGLSYTTPTSGSWVYQTGSQQLRTNVFTSVTSTASFQAEVYDTGNSFTSPTTYTARYTGTHIFTLNFNYSVSSGGGPLRNIPRQLWMWPKINGTRLSTRKQVLKLPATSGTLSTGALSIDLKTNDTVEWEIYYVANDFVERFNTIPGKNNTYMTVQIPQNPVGGTVNVGKLFDPEATVLEFIKSLIEKFNLVFEPLENERNLIQVEPYNEWIGYGQKIDWTSKVDRSIKYQVEHPSLRMPKTFRFSDAEDTDWLNQHHIDTYKKTYGEYTYTSDSDLPNGERQIGGYYAATPVKYIPGSSTMVMPWLVEEQKDKPATGYKFKTRLLSKQPYKPADGATGKLVVLGNIIYDKSFWILDDATNTPMAWDKYRTLLATTDSPTDFKTSVDLHYQNIGYWPYQQDKVYGQVENGLFNKYWAYYVNSLYDIDARLLTCNVVLDPSEIKNIKLNNKYFIDGHYWRINKINGADLVSAASVEVELIKDIGRNIPFGGRKRIGGVNPEEYTDVIISEYTDDGQGKLVNYNTGDTITDSDTIQAGGNVFGYPVYDDVIAWNDQQPVIINPNVISVGTVKLNNNLNNILAVGSGIDISGDSTNVSVQGNNVIVNDAPTETYIQGSNLTLYETTNTQVLYALTESRVVTQSFGSVLINPIYDVGYYPAMASGSEIFTDTTGSVYLGTTIVQGTAEFRQGIDVWGDITLNGTSISASIDKKHGAFYDTSSQFALVTMTPYPMKFNTTQISNGVTIGGVESTEITVSQNGTYNLQFSTQIYDSGGSGDIIYIWFRKNGADIPNSATKLTTKGGNDATVAAWNFMEQMNAGDNLEIMWAVNDTSLYLLYQAAPGPGIPDIPSVIATMTQI